MVQGHDIQILAVRQVTDRIEAILAWRPDAELRREAEVTDIHLSSHVLDPTDGRMLGFFSEDVVKDCHEAGVVLACIPQCGGKKTPERDAFEKSPAFIGGQRSRAGIEGRISVLFRGRGMKR